MEQTQSVKAKFLVGIEYFFALCFSVLISGFYIYGLHGALQNIVFGLLGGALILRYLLIGKFELYLPLKAILAYALIFFVYLIIFVIHFKDGSAFGHSVSNKVLVILFPLIFAFYPIQKQRMYFFYFWIFAVLTLGECIWATYNYYLDYTGPRLFTWSSAIHVYLIPFRIMHHHLSILVVITILLLIYMGVDYFERKKIASFLLSSVFGTALVLFLHILGARIGLLIFYLSMFFIAVYFVVKNKRRAFVFLLPAVIILVGVGFFSIKKMSTLGKKVNETLIDIKSIVKDGPSPEFNISGRIYTAFLAIDFIKRRPLDGCGYYNYEKLFSEYYATYHPEFREDIRLLPPNQILRYMVCIGIPLTLILVFSLGAPLFINSNYHKLLFLGFYIIVFVYCMVEFPLNDNNFFYFFSFTSPWILHFYQSKEGLKGFSKSTVHTKIQN